MKTVKYILAAAIISTALFTGCKKDSSPENNLAPANETTSGPAATMNYQLHLLLPPGALVVWTAGSMGEQQLNFQGTHVFGNMLAHYKYTSTEMKEQDIFSNPVLGPVSVPYNYYWTASFDIQLNSFGPMNTSRSTLSSGVNDALSLSGTCNVGSSSTTFMFVPVKFTADVPITLQTVWLHSVTINSPNYMVTLTLDMSQITNGITREMMAGAIRTDGTILINSNSNTDLYTIIMNNIQNYMLGEDVSNQSISTVNASN